MEIIKKEYKREYEQRVRDLMGIIVNAYLDWYYLSNIDAHTKRYKNNLVTNYYLQPSIQFVNAIVRNLQKELIVITYELERTDKTAISLPILKSKLHKYLMDFENSKCKILKIPANNVKGMKESRNTAIAHFDFNMKDDRLNMKEVKDRLDVLKDCFNSYLFCDVTKYAIDEVLLKKMIRQAEIGVEQLFGGELNSFFDAKDIYKQGDK